MVEKQLLPLQSATMVSEQFIYITTMMHPDKLSFLPSSIADAMASSEEQLFIPKKQEGRTFYLSILFMQPPTNGRAGFFEG